MSKNIEVRIYNSVIRSMLAYGVANDSCKFASGRLIDACSQNCGESKMRREHDRDLKNNRYHRIDNGNQTIVKFTYNQNSRLIKTG